MSLFSGQTNASGKTVASGVTLNSSCYGNVVPIAYGTVRASGNLIWYGDFAATKAGSGGKGGKNGGSAYTYSAYFAFALCEGTIGGVENIWANGTIYSWAYCTANGIGFMSGAQGQAPWGYLTSKHPGQDLGYSGTCYVYWQPGLFGSTAQMQNFAFEIQGIGNGVYSTPDADPAYVVSDMLTNPVYGVGFPSVRLGSLSTFSDYCRASGLVISRLLDSQQDAASTLNDVVQQCNAEFVWSGGQLTIVPYGDQNLSANGSTYTAPSAALYSLGDDDFLDTASGDPVQLSRARPSDRMNSVRLEWLNRSNQYAAEIVEAKDQAAIETYGLRSSDPKQAHQFATLSAATMSATLQLQRQAVRNQYSFTLGWKYCLLDPMDIVEISDANLGLAQQWVRILAIEEDDNGNLAVTAEEYLGGTGGAPLYAFQSGNPYIGNLNASPGPVNAPVIIEPPISLIAGDPQLIIGVSGSSPYWGMADIYMSTDGGTNYELIGRAQKAATVGVTTAALTATTDPDTASLLTLDFSQSPSATLPAASHGTADNFQSALWICNADYSNGELVGYGIETLTGTGTYKLSDSGGGSIYLRRGQLGTAIAAHASGSMVLALDRNVVTIPLPASLSGITLHFKFVSFNLYGGAPTDLATATAYTFTPVVASGGTTGFGGAVGAPTTPASATPAYDIQNDGTVQPGMDIAWTPTTDPNCTSQELQWRPHGGNWTSIMVSATADLYFLSGLQAGSGYDFQVRSVRVGVGTIATQYSSFLTIGTNVAATYPPAPGAPSAPTVTATGATTLAVGWTAVSNQNLAGYDVAYNTVNSLSGATLVNPRPGPLNTGCAIAGLAAGTTYYVFVRAIDTISQTGTWSTSGSATTSAVGTPTINTPTATFQQQNDGTTQGILEVAWSSGGGAWDSYEVQIDNQTNAGAFNPPLDTQVVGQLVTGTNFVVPACGPSANNNNNYKARVRAVLHTPQGPQYSSYSTAGSYVTVTGKTSYSGGSPTLPTFPAQAVTAGPLCMQLAWSSPSDADFDHVQIWAAGNTVNSRPSFGAAVLWADGIKGGSHTIGAGVNNYNWVDTTQACAAVAQTHTYIFYWIVPVDSSGNAGSAVAMTGDSQPQLVTVLQKATLASAVNAPAGGSHVTLLSVSITINQATNVIIDGIFNQSTGGGYSIYDILETSPSSSTLATYGNLITGDASPSRMISQTVALSAGSYPASFTFSIDWASNSTSNQITGGTMTVSALQT